MDTFDHLLNWTLKRGSHPFPGKDGGTCINEAALVAAGFEYKRINRAGEMPECFSRPICHLAMVLNDQASDANRQRLLPYVTRLACADTPEIEQLRADYIRTLTCVYPYGIPFEVGLKALEGALAIGRQAEPFPAEEVKTRMDTARANTTRHETKAHIEPVKATGTASKPTPDRSFFGQVKSWLAMKETMADA